MRKWECGSRKERKAKGIGQNVMNSDGGMRKSDKNKSMGHRAESMAHRVKGLVGS